MAKVKTIKLHHFKEGEPQRQVISILKVIEEINRIYPNITVENLGEADMLIEHIDVNRHKGLGQWIKLVFVAAISFFGTAFTIMAFHNDISINKIFSQVYEQFHRAGSGHYFVF